MARRCAPVPLWLSALNSQPSVSPLSLGVVCGSQVRTCALLAERYTALGMPDKAAERRAEVEHKRAELLESATTAAQKVSGWRLPGIAAWGWVVDATQQMHSLSGLVA